ncbi:membrane protein [Gordonia phage Periwinkle]|nr:membrane protein [Gordonia phage Periwinkle]
MLRWGASLSAVVAVVGAGLFVSPVADGVGFLVGFFDGGGHDDHSGSAVVGDSVGAHVVLLGWCLPDTADDTFRNCIVQVVFRCGAEDYARDWGVDT